VVSENVAQFPAVIAASLEEALTQDATCSRLEREILPDYLIRQRWYRSKAKQIAKASFDTWERFPTTSGDKANFTVVKVVLNDGNTERYVLPLVEISGLKEDFPRDKILCRLLNDHNATWIVDATETADYRVALLREALKKNMGPETSSELIRGEQSNTSMMFSSGHFLKLYRRIEDGINPEPEMLAFLERAGYPSIPSFLGNVAWQPASSTPVVVAVAQARIDARENAWEYVLERMSPLARIAGNLEMETVPFPGHLADWVKLLGKRTAGLHLVLGSCHDDSAFAPEPLLPDDITAIRTSTEKILNDSLEQIKGRHPEAADIVESALARLIELETALSKDALGQKIRVHGDLHLGQILHSGHNFWFLDFEGEPTRILEERRRKYSPLRDTAGMLRSFHYASHVAKAPALATTMTRLFLESYFEIFSDSRLLPQTPSVRDDLLDLYVLEKTAYELHYELNNRPDWVEIPLLGLKFSNKS
jgi:trehalose synthase-fused probable maltokinase